MPQPDYSYCVGDLLPVIRETLYDPASTPENPVAADLTGGTVSLYIRIADHSAPEVVRSATIVDPANGLVEYDPQIADTAVAALYNARWVVTYADARPASFPNTKSTFTILVSART